MIPDHVFSARVIAAVNLVAGAVSLSIGFYWLAVAQFALAAFYLWNVK